ncbi:protein kinase [Candidatus Bathyarchaeota archaeon]|nr:protein kinase [Candidatus Bathyarchaeota archaeon]
MRTKRVRYMELVLETLKESPESVSYDRLSRTVQNKYPKAFSSILLSECLEKLVLTKQILTIKVADRVFYSKVGIEVERSEPEELSENDILGDRYVLNSRVGKGTYGEVWRATDKSLERTVAVKLLHGGIQDFEQLKTEAKAVSALTHKNIIIVHDLGSDEKRGWLVTEFIEGPSLHEHLAKLALEEKWLSFDEAQEIIAQCLEAIEFAHEKKRVHGDVKPGNILMPETGEIKLGDFGVAKILSGGVHERTDYSQLYKRRLGSSSYCAPEVLNGEPRDFQSDLFSVGLLAYILLTGQHPFMHKSGLIPITKLIQDEDYTPPSPSEIAEDIPDKYEKIVLRLLEKDKTKRYQSAREVLDEWRKKIETLRCRECNAENPISDKYCGQCAALLRPIQKVAPLSEKDLTTSLALFSAGMTREAIELMQVSLGGQPNFPEGWNSLGYMLNNERRYEEAIEACTKSIGIDSEYSRAYQTRGFAKSNLGRFNEAIEDFGIALEKETDNSRKSSILYQRGYARKLAGKFDEALEDANEATKLDETNVKARRLRATLKPLVERGY